MARATDQEIDEMGDAQYALECVLARLTEGELVHILSDLPPRAGVLRGSVSRFLCRFKWGMTDIRA